MECERFEQLVDEALETLPEMFRERLHNLAIMVEDLPPPHASQHCAPGAGSPRLLLGIFQGVPTTKTSVFNLITAPSRILLYQKNIEAVCRNDAEIRQQVRQTVMHELGHYFGMTEEELRKAGLG